MSIMILVILLIVLIIGAILDLFIAYPSLMIPITVTATIIIFIIVIAIKEQKKIDGESANDNLFSKKKEQKKYDSFLQEEEPVFTSIKVPDNTNAKFPLEKWLNENIKPIIPLRSELL